MRNTVLKHVSMLDHLDNKVLPRRLRERFMAWCVMEQARPALADLLAGTNLAGAGAALHDADDLLTLKQLAAAIKVRADELAGHGKMGTAAVAALFEFSNLVQAAAESDPDASAGAFFSARVCGWQALVHEDRHHPARKRDAEFRARLDQEHVLRRLVEVYARSQ